MKHLLLACLLTATSAIAQAAGPTATVSWLAPITNTDGSPITQPLTYNVYLGQAATAAACSLGATPALTGITALTVTITTGLADGTTECAAVTAVEGGVESAKSNIATKTFPPATPNSPATVTMQ